MSKLTEIPQPAPASDAAGALPPLPDPAFHDARHHIKIYQGDCLDILRAIPPEKVDLIFADPPYFLSNDGITCHAGRMVSVNKGQWDKSRGAQENHEFNRQWLAACQRVLKPNGSLWVSGTAHVIHSVGFAMQQLGFKLLNDISWVKPNPPPNLSCRYFTHATETIIWAAKNKKSRHTFHYKLMKEHAGGKQMKSVWTLPPPERAEKRFGKHPTQKPVALLERILLASSSAKDLVLDPFMGSGTTAIAAMRLRRFFCGIEVSTQYIGVALRRIGAELVAVVFTATTYPPCHSERAPRERGISGVLKQIDLDLRGDPVDRSGVQARKAQCPLPASGTSRLVHRELKFFFVGADERAVVFSVVADSMEDAWRSFRSSPRSHISIFSVIKTETEIYLAS